MTVAILAYVVISGLLTDAALQWYYHRSGRKYGLRQFLICLLSGWALIPMVAAKWLMEGFLPPRDR